MVILGLLGYALGIDPRLLIGGAEMVSKMTGGGQQQQQVARPGEVGAPKDQVGRFVASILAENEDVWRDVLPRRPASNSSRRPMVLFNGVTPRAAARRNRRWGRSIARWTRRSISTRRSSPT